MGRKARVYSKIDEADEIIKGLCEKQPELLWAVKPNTIIVLGIENSERSEKNKTLAKIIPIKGPEKALFQINNIAARYIIQTYWSDWNLWSMKQKQWILLHELLHCHPDFERTIRHDCEDWAILLDKVGVNWTSKRDELPDLMNEDVKFNLKLLPNLEIEGEDGDEIVKDDEKE